MELSLGGFVSTDDNLPFWLQTNTQGAVGATTNYLVAGSGAIDYSLTENSFLSAGAGFFLHDGTLNDFERDQLFVSYTNKWIEVIVGSKHAKQRFNGLSISSDNFLNAGNNRALPGVLIQSPKALNLSQTFSFNYGLGHFMMNDDRYVSDPRVHFKMLGLNVKVSQRVTLVGELHHYAMWGGTSPDRGELPDSFTDFKDVFLGREGEGEERNSIGNHLGLYNFEMHIKQKAGTYVFYHQHPFEDGSGSALKNFPDGIWGFAMLPETENYTSVFKGLVLEYIQTTSQSGGAGDAGRDNYFGNNIYQTGWNYEGRVIGMPLITVRNNTRIKAIHAAIHLEVKKLEITFKTTLNRNLGTFFNPFDPKQDNIYSVLDLGYQFKTLGHVGVQTGYDYLGELKDQFGVALRYRYNF
ncbi:MAG: capsule assembly Wzi family protein [Gilvibacter sp.]